MFFWHRLRIYNESIGDGILEASSINSDGVRLNTDDAKWSGAALQSLRYASIAS